MTAQRKRTKKTKPRKYDITLSGRFWVKDLPPTKIKTIESGFKDRKYLPFYKSSGTSVITSRKPRDFQDLYFKPKEFEAYIPNILKYSPSTKKHKKSRKKGGR